MNRTNFEHAALALLIQFSLFPLFGIEAASLFAVLTPTLNLVLYADYA